MFAVVLASSAPVSETSGAVILIPILLTSIALALPVTIPPVRAWHQHRPAIFRLAIAVLIAVVLAVACHTAEDGDVVILDRCAKLTPSDWEYWLLGCPWRPYYPF